MKIVTRLHCHCSSFNLPLKTSSDGQHQLFLLRAFEGIFQMISELRRMFQPSLKFFDGLIFQYFKLTEETIS